LPTSMHVCSPYCGICKPPKEAPLICPACNTLNDPELGEHGSCKACGAELPPRKVIEPVHCLKVDALCARPCGQSQKPPRTAAAGCIYHTPL